MPYGNFDDIHSLHAVYNQSLKEDNDMDLEEFIGEKILCAGFDPTEDKEAKGTPHHPVDTNAVVQIQSGALSQPVTQQTAIKKPVAIPAVFNSTETSFAPQEYYSVIFHPPLPLLSTTA
ncbi:MAG: hypothetical protein KGO81_13480 [Bacteroidota bacterium]|nr:hypothetical protein [Bacteroidota bacterium]